MEDELRAEMKEYAESAVEFAEFCGGPRLDYSRESILILEGLLGSVYDYGEQVGYTDEHINILGVWCGAYLGEVMLRHEYGELGFKWGRDTDGEPVLVRDFDHSKSKAVIHDITRPITKCTKRLLLGPEESVSHYYVSTIRLFASTTSAEEAVRKASARKKALARKNNVLRYGGCRADLPAPSRISLRDQRGDARWCGRFKDHVGRRASLRCGN